MIGFGKLMHALGISKITTNHQILNYVRMDLVSVHFIGLVCICLVRVTEIIAIMCIQLLILSILFSPGIGP